MIVYVYVCVYACIGQRDLTEIILSYHRSPGLGLKSLGLAAKTFTICVFERILLHCPDALELSDSRLKSFPCLSLWSFRCAYQTWLVDSFDVAMGTLFLILSTGPCLIYLLLNIVFSVPGFRVRSWEFEH